MPTLTTPDAHNSKTSIYLVYSLRLIGLKIETHLISREFFSSSTLFLVYVYIYLSTRNKEVFFGKEHRYSLDIYYKNLSNVQELLENVSELDLLENWIFKYILNILF